MKPRPRGWVFPLLLGSVLGMSCGGCRDSASDKNGLTKSARDQIVAKSPATAQPSPDPSSPTPSAVISGFATRAPGERGWTELMEAAEMGDRARVEDLLARGTDVNAKGNAGLTALMVAADPVVAEALLAKGADIDAKGPTGMTALSYALVWNRADVAQVLLNRGADPNATSTHGFPVLQEAALRGQATLVRALLEKGADPNAKDKSGMTALLRAVQLRHGTVAEALLDKGADPNAKDIYGQSPLILAAERGDEASVRLLLAKGADPNAIARHSSMGGTSADTALKRAAATGSTTVVRALLDRGADLNGKGSSGDTPLMIAAQAGQKEVVQLLVDRGADIDSRNQDGKTALGLAEAAGRPAVVQILLARAATKEKAKETALLYYFQRGRECALKTWSPMDRTSKLLLNLSQCPDDVFLAERAHALIAVSGTTITEIRVKPNAKETAAPRPSADEVLLAGYLADGRLAAVTEKVGPADDSDLSLFALENRKWNLIANKNCGRYFNIEKCLGRQIMGRKWNDWGEEREVWHPKVALNPFVVSRGVVALENGRFILDKRNAAADEPWGYVKFSVKNQLSLLFHNSRLEQGHVADAMVTSSIYLQTRKDPSPVSVAEGIQLDTAIEHKYLLIRTYGDLRLVDIETGEQPIDGLRFAFWDR